MQEGLDGVPDHRTQQHPRAPRLQLCHDRKRRGDPLAAPEPPLQRPRASDKSAAGAGSGGLSDACL